MSHLTELTANGKGFIVLGEFIIKYFDDNTIWIQHKDGEGMGVPKQDFEKMIEKYFYDNF